MRNFVFEDNVTREEMYSFAESANVKTHFEGSYAWGELSKHRGRVPYYVGVREDGKLVATAVLLQKSLVMGYSYFYIPRGFTMDHSDRELLRFFTKSIHKFCKAHKSIYFKIDPDIKLHTIDEDGNVIDGESNYDLVEDLKKMGYRHLPLTYLFETEQPRFTFRIPMDGTMDEIEARYSRTTKARIRQADAAGIEVTKGSPEELSEFIRLMSMTEKRKGFYSHSEDYYRHFYDILSKDDMVTLYLGWIDIPKLISKVEQEKSDLGADYEKLADMSPKKAEKRRKELDKKNAALDKQLALLEDKPRERVVASAYLITHYIDKSWALYAGNDMDYGKFFANYMVYREQIRDTKERGDALFDVFGTVGRPGDDRHLAGLFEFKKKWGGEFTEFIGEFDYVENKLMYFMYSKLIPLYHKRVNKKLHDQLK